MLTRTRGRYHPKKGPGNNPLASLRSCRGLWPLLALALRASLWRNTPSAFTTRSERPRNGRTFQLSHSREPPFEIISPSRHPCGSITVREWRRVSVTERVPTTCFPLQRVATRGCACRSAHPECRHISALSATLRLQPYDERSKHRLRFNETRSVWTTPNADIVTRAKPPDHGGAAAMMWAEARWRGHVLVDWKRRSPVAITPEATH